MFDVIGAILLLGLTSCISYKLRGEEATYYFSAEIMALINAAQRGDKVRVSELVARGAIINYVGKEGVTPLIWMLGAQNKDGMRALLENRADPNLATFRNDSPITLAAQMRDSEPLGILLDYGGDPNAYGKEGKTALLLAISYHSWDTMRLLLERGADINKMDTDRNSSPLMLAASHGQYEQVLFLLNKGADYRLKNQFGLDLAFRMSTPSGDGTEWKQKVKNELEKRGITIPPPVTNESVRKLKEETKAKKKEE